MSRPIFSSSRVKKEVLSLTESKPIAELATRAKRKRNRKPNPYRDLKHVYGAEISPDPLVRCGLKSLYQ